MITLTTFLSINSSLFLILDASVAISHKLLLICLFICIKASGFKFGKSPCKFIIILGSEEKLYEGLKIGCSGIISATCNVTSILARKVYDDFKNNIDQSKNEKLCNVRKVFEKFNLISSLHSYMSIYDPIFKNVLPVIDLLSKSEEKKLFEDLENLDFNIKY